MDLIPNTNLVFLHIPKTAGLSIRSAFAIKTHGYEHSVASEQDKIYLGPDFIRFTVVREPVKRYISAFKYNSGISKQLKTGIRRVLAGSEELRTDINAFTHYLRSKHADIASASDHFRRQMYFVRLGRPHIILRQENLETDIQIIKKLAPESFNELPQRNVSSVRFDVSAVDAVLSEENEQFVRDYYRLDTVFLGYDKKQDV